jgi:triacylglycerol esterase/lipase EstA (alpha/beta hydrolase family)
VHGAFGSRLVNASGKEVWPGKLGCLLLGDYSNIELQIDPQTLDPRPDTLAVNQRRFYVFEYDWRQDNVQSAQALHHFLNQIRVDHKDPNLKFDFVTHSKGGLVVRYFARYGSVDVLSDNDFPVGNIGNDYIRRLVLLGTPSLGSALAVQNLIQGMSIGIFLILKCGEDSAFQYPLKNTALGT